jgi:hypothetical protein
MSDDDEVDEGSSGHRRGWRFNFSKVRNFRVLPKAVPLEESSSDNDVPNSPAPVARQVRPPKFLSVVDLNVSSRLPTSDIFGISRRAPLGDTTIESLQLESQEIALREASEHCAQLKRERDQLAADLRRLKAEHHRQLTDFRGRLEKTAAKLEKTAGILRSQVREETQRLNFARASQEQDERFVQIREREAHIRKTRQSFVCAQESVAALANVLQYSPLAESEFNVISTIGTFDSPLGRAVAEFIDAAKKVLVRAQDEV